MASPTMTLKEVTSAMRDLGFRTGEMFIADSIESGRYPFGEVVSAGRTGRRRFLIYRVDFEKWIREKTGGKQ